MQATTTTHAPNRRSTWLTSAALVAALALTIAPTAAVAQDTTGAAAPEFAVLVRGELFTDDLTEAQVVHDAVAAGGEEAAKAAGDFYHLAGVSTSLLGGSEGSFLGVDRWSALDNIEAFYSDPAAAEGFATLFAGEPTIEVFERQPDWFQWGDMPASTGDQDLWITVVRGTLADADPAVAQAAHDFVASTGQEPSMAAGDISHTVYTGVEDPTQFLAFDVWTSHENMEAVYSDPDFQAIFAPLFAEQPSVVIYSSTDWHQW
jgi:quinol monooxygenase YgiN